jgi:hypothetical protein
MLQRGKRIRIPEGLQESAKALIFLYLRTIRNQQSRD